MEAITKFKPYINIIILLFIAILLLAFTVTVNVSNEAGVRTELPDQVGEWTGNGLRFCLNSECQKHFYVNQLDNTEICPECGSKLDTMTKIEKDVLPPDTFLLKKKYTHPDGRGLFVTLVLSGKDRASIHRPELCLTGQGNEIINGRVINVEMDSGTDLGVKVLNLEQTQPGVEEQRMKIPKYYAYWFVGKGRETPYHMERMLWMATDMIFKNISHRWAYISISGMRSENEERNDEEIQSFVHDFYPQVSKNKG